MAARQRLEQLAARYELPDGAAGRILRLLELVAASPVSLTTVRDADRAVDVHVADSLTGLLVSDLRDARWIADLGAGAGFPGLVLALARPEAKVTLVESVGRKAAFLSSAISELGLGNATVAPVRVEDWADGAGSQDVVTARALAPLTTLVEYAAPLLRLGGALVAWKGPAGASELADGSAAAARLGLSAPEVRAIPADPEAPEPSERVLYVSRKVSPTPSGYPRRAGIARKRPIQA